jgi:hypothetical protein
LSGIFFLHAVFLQVPPTTCTRPPAPDHLRPIAKDNAAMRTWFANVRPKPLGDGLNSVAAIDHRSERTVQKITFNLTACAVRAR